MNPYPAYRPSGVEWLGDIPEHWAVKMAKTLGRIRYGLGQPPRESAKGVPLIRATNVERGRIVENDLIRVDPSDLPVGRDALLSAQEIIVVRSGAYTADSAIIPTRYEGAVTGYDMVMTITAAIPEFVAFALLAPYLRDAQLIVASTRSAQPHLNAEELGESLVLVPSLAEQAAIVEYLDRETQRIDALVGKTRQLIGRLQEYRTALITRTVTRGLPSEIARDAGLEPSPRFKPTGVEWLGEVPKHWTVRPFRRALRESLRYGANEAAELDDPDLPRFIRITDIDDGGRLRDETFRSLPVPVAEPYLLQPGDLLFARSGSVGRTFLYDESWGVCAYAGYLIRARVDHKQAMPEFISYFSESHAYASWLGTVAIQATIENISAERYARMLLPLPPLHEQRTIVAFLDCETERIDALVAKMRLLIERLQEYRTALITAAVTGKVDVRESVAADGS